MDNKRNIIIAVVTAVVSVAAYLFFRKDIKEILRVRKAKKLANSVE